MKTTITGYPSIDRPWLKHFDSDAEKRANNAPTEKIIWEVIEERLREYKDIPAIEYFGRIIPRLDFINDVYFWVSAFHKIGIKEDEVVPFYGIFTPDVCAMIFALNIIGACPYFLKLSISNEALCEETKDTRIAIVFDQMWDNVSNVFSMEQFKKIILFSITDSMPAVKKQIVSFLNKVKIEESNSEKYLSVSEIKKNSKEYKGSESARAPFVPNRPVFITSSSGTTKGSVPKSVVATNESVIAQIYMVSSSDVQIFPKDRCLNHFPPSAATSLNILFLLSLYMGETVVIDPRVSENDFYEQITKLRPNLVLTTGSAWEAFFNRVSAEMEKGKHFNFEYAKGWTVGGE